jgi:putative transcriptional regulator
LSTFKYIMSDIPFKSTDSFGRRVYRMRRYLDMTQEELADRIESSRSHVSAIERGEVEPRLETMKKVAKAFKISLDTLVKGL